MRHTSLSLVGAASIAFATQVTPLAAALAQDAPPARNGNVYNGTAHQPSAGATASEERNAGVAAAPGQAQSQRQQLDEAGQQALQHAQTPTGTAAGCSADGKVCPSR